MNIGFCIGNGASKNKFKLTQLKDAGPIYGCNRLIESLDVDNTIVVDKNVLIDLISQGYNKKTNIYTRKSWQTIIEAENLYFLDDPIQDPIKRWDRESQWGSGPHAINLAATQGLEIIVMIGYDLYDVDISPECWIYQISRLIKKFSNTQFVQIQPKNWKTPPSWISDNFTTDSFNSLKQMLKDIK